MKIQFNQSVPGTYILTEEFFTSRPTIYFEQNIIYNVQSIFLSNVNSKEKLSFSSRNASKIIFYSEIDAVYKEMLKIKFDINGMTRTITINLLNYPKLNFKFFK